MQSLESCTTVGVERAQNLTREAFQQRYLTGSGKPVIVTDELCTWGALSKWSFEFFESRYGSEPVTVCTGLRSRCMKMMKLGDYIDYLDAPGEQSPGFWIDPDTRF